MGLIVITRTVRRLRADRLTSRSRMKLRRRILASGRGQLNVVAMNDGDNSPHPVLVGLTRAGWKSVHSRAAGHDRIRKPSLRSVVLLSAD
jgi:hypothetical protein